MPSYGTPLGPRPGAKKRANKLSSTGLGRSLVNQRAAASKGAGASNSDRYTTDFGEAPRNLQSVTQERSLDEFLATAELAGTDFTTERTSNIRIVASGCKSAPNPYALTPEQRKELAAQHYENAGKLTVPRRPQWTKDMTAHELDLLEREAFLNWRRSLADLQENQNLLLTPFERNIEVWRQLWRVIERSDLVVQIVDARNPLTYRSEDLDKYVAELAGDRKVLLLVNKADYLSLGQREAWQKFFVDHGIRFAFFSAKSALKRQEAEELAGTAPSEPVAPAEIELNTTRILSVDELEALFKQAAPERPQEHQLQIGLVGYPNVGKSSTINSLIGGHKVSVSSTPGKTKHFQTIQLDPSMMLCDCPGLVFPNFAQTKGDLVCNGVLPIDQLREFLGPVELVCERVPKYFMEAVYGINIPTVPKEEGGSDRPTAMEVLSAYAKARGYMRTAGRGEPDTSRAARYVLKDYVDGKLLYIVPPPGLEESADDFNTETFGVESLSTARKNQILDAIKESHEGTLPDHIDLEAELKCLKFSQHNASSSTAGASKGKQQKSKQSKSKGDDLSTSEVVDDDFFGKSLNGSTASVPFHLQGAAKGSSKKKHFKGRKGQQ